MDRRSTSQGQSTFKNAFMAAQVSKPFLQKLPELDQTGRMSRRAPDKNSGVLDGDLPNLPLVHNVISNKLLHIISVKVSAGKKSSPVAQETSKSFGRMKGINKEC